MERFLRHLVAAALLAVGPLALAAPCIPGTLADYIALGSCEIEATTFSDFDSLDDLPTGAIPIEPGDIAVTPVDATSPGFTFTLDTSAATGEVFSTLIRFNVLAGGGASLTGASAMLTGGTATGDGVALLIEELCRDGLFATPPSGCGGVESLALLPFVTSFDADVDESVAFVDTASLDVVANFIIDGGLEGTAELGSGTLRFVTTAVVTPVPEPPSAALVLTALLLLAAFARQRVARIHD